jgi:hypothetical protein
MRGQLWLVALVFSLSGCGPVYNEPISGPYRLWATDIEEQMHVCYALEDGCIGRIPETVFEVGFDDQYVVAATHPSPNSTAYFYIIRGTDGPNVDPSISVRGPFDATAFAAEQSRLGLPKLKSID